ncbi:MAG: phage tail tape measure protein, partial [Clostridia bacterium]|nr:phage tail tape measure protein [Clostridia bacterium]
TLAAAGGMDLAYASDMVTDSMSALNLQTSDLDMYMDQMAKTSQKSNTSVQQLGEAILVCGGTASLTGQDLDVVNTALGVMADNGIKGSEGGTKLRNVLLSLSSPTKNGAAELARLGVSIYDAEGNMRQLDEIMGDLNKALSSLSQEEKTAAISTIFNKRDIAAVNALLESTNGRFAELDALIKDSAGAAEEMAGTMESGLAGTERSWASALEGLKIETGEIFASLKQTALTDMTGIVRDLTKALASADGDWMKIGDAVGQAVSNLLVKINEYLPKVVAIAVNIISVFLSGIAENTDMLVSSAELIIGSLIDGLNFAAPNLVAVAVPLLLTLADGILSSLPSILSAGHEILMTLVSGLTQAAPELLTRLAETTVLIAQSFTENAPVFLETAVSLGEALFGGILSAASVLAEAEPSLLASFGQMLAEGLPSAILFLTSALTDAFPLLLSTAFSQLEFALQTILSVLPSLLGDAIPMLLDWLGSFLLEQLPVLIAMAGSLVTELVGHLSEILVTTLPLILSAVFRLIDSIIA